MFIFWSDSEHDGFGKGNVHGGSLGTLGQSVLSLRIEASYFSQAIKSQGFILFINQNHGFQSVMAGGRGQGGEGQQGGLLSILGHSVGLLTRKNKR